MSSKIKTKFQTIKGKFGERQVRYLTAGSGPVIFLLHQSPKSADEYKPLMEMWSNDFLMIAPDTPGFGASDPLESQKVTIEEIACLLYTSPSPRDRQKSRMPSSA